MITSQRDSNLCRGRGSWTKSRSKVWANAFLRRWLAQLGFMPLSPPSCTTSSKTCRRSSVPPGPARGFDIALGNSVLHIVEGCTDADVQPKPPLDAAQDCLRRTHIATASPSVILVSASDKLHNARAILATSSREPRSEDELLEPLQQGCYALLTASSARSMKPHIQVCGRRAADHCSSARASRNGFYRSGRT